MRQLASIKKIKDIKPAENSDNLNLVYIDGWQVVVRKDENWRVGDLCVYIEVDSMLPDTEAFKFLTDKGIKRLRMVKLRGNISQGLVLPPSVLPDGHYDEDQDVTDVLGIVKYEPPVKFSAGIAKGSFPTNIISKTDETRIQNVPHVIDDFKGLPYYISVKVDGTSVTMLMMTEDGEAYTPDVPCSFEVCSRSLVVADSESSVYWKVAKKYSIEEKLKEYPWFILQGEVAGSNIQSNRLNLSDYELFVFNIYDQRTCKYLDYKDFIATAEMLGVPTVPILEEGDSFEHSFDKLFEMADGKYDGTDNWREGIVIRLQKDTWHKKLGRSSFKVISHAFDADKNKNRPDDE